MITEVRNAQALLEALERKDDEILVCGDYCGDIMHRLLRSEGFHGLTAGQIISTAFITPLLANLIESIVNIKTGVPKEQAKIERKLKLYHAMYKREDEILLWLNQLDY